MSRLNGRPVNDELVCLLCEEKVMATYLCKKHYHQKYREDRARVQERIKAAKPAIKKTPCVINGCNRAKVRHSKMCTAHYSRCGYWGFTEVEFIRLYNESSCNICKATPVVLDHKHGAPCESSHKLPKSGCQECFRGTLCHRCNTALGLLMDSPKILLSAVGYIENKRVLS